MTHKKIILIPARLASTRLPRKPLADIAGKPMIIRVAQRAAQSAIDEVIIASGDIEIIECAKDYNIKSIKTHKTHISGTDRIYEALTLLPNASSYEYIVNLQGDLPNIAPNYINIVLEILEKTKADIATLGALIKTNDEKANSNTVKIIASSVPYYPHALKALYFTRAVAPYGDGDLYHHIGIYAYKRSALEKFISLSPSPLEQRESLEQLRALENGMNIAVALVDECPIGVDSLQDLEFARKLLENKN